MASCPDKQFAEQQVFGIEKLDVLDFVVIIR